MRRASTGSRFALAALSGGLYWAAYPPTDVWPLAFVGWVPLLLALSGVSTRRAFLLGATQGLVANAIGFLWLPAVIRTFGSLPWIVCGLLALLVCAYNGCAVGVATWLVARAERRGWHAGLVFVLAVAAVEACYPLIVPTFAAAQVHRVPMLMQLADVGGMVLVGISLTMANVGLAELVAARLERRRTRWSLVAIGASGPAVALLYGVWCIRVIDARVAAAPGARIAVIQGNTPHAGVTLHDSVETYRSASVRAQAEGPFDLIVWPETAIASAFRPADLETTLRDYVVRTPEGDEPLAAPVLGGTMIRRGGQHMNSAVLFDAHGQLLGTYDKVHPLVIGEYVPLGDRFPRLYRWLPNAGHLAAGSVDQPPLLLAGHSIAPLICYEDVLPGYVNEVAARSHPELLVNLTNDSWFGDSAAARTHYALAQFRAVEHRRYLVRASNSGISGFVDPVGRSSQETPLLEAATPIGQVHWMSGTTPYETLGDRPWWCCAAIVVAMACVRRDRLRVGRRAGA